MTVTFTHASDTDAMQRRLYNAHYRRLYSACLRITGNAMDAEETMHDAFMKIFANMHKISSTGEFYAWSQSIAIRTAIDRTRKRKINFESEEMIAASDEEPEDGETAPPSVESIKSQLACLPCGYRVILSLRLFENCEFSEIADMLKIKESTVRSQFARGRQKLVQALKNSEMKPHLNIKRRENKI